MYSLTNMTSSETIEDFVQAAEYGLHMEMKDRILKARSDAKMTQEQLATAVGKTRGAVAQWESGEVRPRQKTLEEIAKATRKPLGWLMGGMDLQMPSAPRIGLAVVGEVSAGLWQEADFRFETTYEPVATHPGYPENGQRLYRVKGDSINRVAESGEYLHAVELHKGGIRFEDGDLVIVQRMQHGLAEYTAKQIIWLDGRWVLRPLSHDDRWQEDIILDGDDDTEIKVTDIVIAKWSPIARRGMFAKRDRDPFRS